MARFRVSPRAQLDIIEIKEFISRDNPVRALSYVRELREKISQTAEKPLVYRERTELHAGIRAARHGSYLIFFRLEGEIMNLLRVWHGARDTSELFQD